MPNVSLCVQENEVHYNKVETKLVVYYDIQNTSSPTTIWTNYDGGVVKSIEVDGELLDSALTTTYQFDSIGEHIIKYEFNNPTTVGNNAPLFYTLVTVKRVVIPNTFTSIGHNAFNASVGLTSIVIPNSVISIGNTALSQCSSLTSVIIPNSVTSIGNAAFSSCSSLTSATIGNGVTSIGGGAFQSCPSLTSITIEATTPPTLADNNAFNYTNDCPIYVPSASVEAYKAATNWSNYASRIQAIQ